MVTPSNPESVPITIHKFPFESVFTRVPLAGELSCFCIKGPLLQMSELVVRSPIFFTVGPSVCWLPLSKLTVRKLLGLSLKIF